VTLESAFPWISAASALAAGLSAPEGRGGRALRAVALGALALYAYFRWITPTSVPLALTCLAIGQASSPEGPGRWRRWTIVLPILGWLVLANLYRSTGDGAGVFLNDVAKAALLAALLAGAGYGAWRVSRWTSLPRAGLAAEAAALFLMGVMSLTLDWDFWPVMAGALLALASFALVLYAGGAAGKTPPPRAARVAWGLSFVGQAAMAYAFLR